MTRPQQRFALALALFAAWVTALALMAGFSGEPPRPRVPSPTAQP